MTAAALGEKAVVELLLKHDADGSIKDGDGDTALSHAMSNQKVEIVELLK
jgi:ankyrin repeat protein